MKKIKIINTVVMMFCIITFSNTAFADNNISIGTYIQLGKYDNEPIIWKCADIDDENGILMLSDKILCYKSYDVGSDDPSLYSIYGTRLDNSPRDEYGYGFWEESNIRTWLNSKETGGNILWPSGFAPVKAAGKNGSELGYHDEDGFISSQNFSDSEIGVLKSVSQWQILSNLNKELATNGVNHVFQTNEFYYSDGRTGGRSAFYSDVEHLSHIEGAMYRLSDTIFLLDVRQIYKLWTNFGTVAAYPTEIAAEEINNYDGGFGEELKYRYCLRTQSGSDITFVYGDVGYSSFMPAYAYGIRPAFYLNESNYQILSGSGTEADPYIVDGKFEQESVAVFCQGEQLKFDQEPIEENGRLLVPVRAIFESLGAEVTYDEGDGVITATNDERTVVMQIDNTEMGNGTEIITLDVAPQIVGDRTMVPLRAISESFGADVEYIENLNRVVIDKPTLPMDFGEGVGIEDWQQDWYKEIYGD